MPTYDYSCAKCGASFDHFQSIKAKPLTTCPKEACPRKRWGKGRVKRQIGLGAGIGLCFNLDFGSSGTRKSSGRREISRSLATSATIKFAGFRHQNASQR